MLWCRESLTLSSGIILASGGKGRRQLWWGRQAGSLPALGCGYLHIEDRDAAVPNFTRNGIIWQESLPGSRLARVLDPAGVGGPQICHR